jgi:hypothetical protein
VDARSLANPDPGVTVRRGPLSVHTDPLPAGRYGSTWDEARPAASPVLLLELTNVRSLSVDLTAARPRCGTVRVRSDGPVAVTLTGPARGARVAGGPTVTLDRAGTRTVSVRC